jgi:O-succinylbenzoic acid--CoA ligase
MSWPSIDWNDTSTHVLFNPRTPQDEVQGVEQRLTALRPLDSHFWIATSGSTAQVSGQFKWVALSKAAILASAQAVNRHLNASSSDVWITVLPGFHVGGIGIHARAHLTQSCVIDGLFRDSSGTSKWDARHFHDVCLNEGATLGALVPAQVYDLVQAKLQAPPSLRALVIGGGAFSEALYFEAVKLGWPVLPSYGMTECCSQIATASLQSLKASPPRFPELQVLSHVEVEQIPDGRLRIKSPSLLTGFAVLTPDQDRWIDPKCDGWFQSEDRGDIIRTSEGAALSIRGRSSDFVKIGGESVDLNRLSAILTEVRAQAGSSIDLVILPIADERLGTVIHGVAAAAQESPDALEARTLFDRFNSRVLPFERTRKLHFVPQIPRSPLQKLLKSQLLEWLQS